MPKAYLTIDDSPWGPTEKLTDFLCERNIPAILFSCGIDIEKKPHAIEYAIKNGLTIANHGYAHTPASDMSPQEWADDLELCEHLIEAAYRRCDATRKAKYYRFPYIDRGDGVRVERAFAEHGEGGFAQNDAVRRIQDYLRENGFNQPFTNLTRDYPHDAADCLFTYTSGDWMLTRRHLGKWPYKSVQDLIDKANADETLAEQGVNHVLLMHDQAEIFDGVCALIDYFAKKGARFLGYDAA